MLKSSQNNEEKLFNSEKLLDETAQIQPQTEKEPEFEQEKTESSQVSIEKAGLAPAPLNIKIPSLVSDSQAKEDKIFRDIEAILSEDMEEIYKNLPENLKEDFKNKGEETAKEIKNIISEAKIIVSKILILIKNWFLMVPGVNKFFLEQECKIKTEKILNLAKKIKDDEIR